MGGTYILPPWIQSFTSPSCIIFITLHCADLHVLSSQHFIVRTIEKSAQFGCDVHGFLREAPRPWDKHRGMHINVRGASIGISISTARDSLRRSGLVCSAVGCKQVASDRALALKEARVRAEVLAAMQAYLGQNPGLRTCALVTHIASLSSRR